ncbi:hypothetical protein EXS70_03225 [Candidatus Peribacteria bacterium]|nr:hypothetical protein [Candidatus Peribacteria bacterium]
MASPTPKQLPPSDRVPDELEVLQGDSITRIGLLYEGMKIARELGLKDVNVVAVVKGIVRNRREMTDAVLKAMLREELSDA